MRAKAADYTLAKCGRLRMTRWLGRVVEKPQLR